MAKKPFYFQVSLPLSQAQEARFPDGCCCCSGPVGPNDKKDFKHDGMVFSIPVCPECRTHWKRTFWGDQVFSFGFFMLIALAVAAGNSPAVVMGFGFIVASLLALSFLILGLGIRPKKKESHVAPGKEPARIVKQGNVRHFQFGNPRFALAFAELNGQDRKQLLTRWELDPETLARKK